MDWRTCSGKSHLRKGKFEITVKEFVKLTPSRLPKEHYENRKGSLFLAEVDKK